MFDVQRPAQPPAASHPSLSFRLYLSRVASYVSRLTPMPAPDSQPPTANIEHPTSNIQHRTAPTSLATPRPINLRSISLGLLGTIAISALTPYNDWAVNNTYLIGN